MKKRIIPTTALASVLTLAACAEVPEEIARFMDGFSAYDLTSEVADVSSAYNEDHKDASGQVTGNYKENVVLHNERENFSYTVSESWSGDAVAKDDTVGYELSARVVSLSRASDGTYVKTTDYTGTEGQTETVVEKGLLEGNVSEDIIYRISGDNSTNYGGFYYGDWLKAQTRNYVDFMSVNQEDQTLIYETPKIGVAVDSQSWYQLYYLVDSKGMILTRVCEAYDEKSDTFNDNRMDVTYVYNG